MADEDRGVGDPERFPADDLEQLYQQGGLSGAVRIQGKALNVILKTDRYPPDEWFLLTAGKITRWLDE
jgi:hypothetical protein